VGDRGSPFPDSSYQSKEAQGLAPYARLARPFRESWCVALNFRESGDFSLQALEAAQDSSNGFVLLKSDASS